MKLALTCVATLTLAAHAGGQTPDAVVSEVAFDWNDYGEQDGIHAYSFGTKMCNAGDGPLDVDPYFETPIVGQNLFCITGGRIVQLGYGFPTVRVCALNENSCGNCQPTACATLGAGCADSSLIHDGSSGWGKWAIDANRGEWPAIPPGPSGDQRVLDGRIQIESAALGDPSSVYLAESQIVSGHDQQTGRGANNVSWREVDFGAFGSPTSIGPPTSASRPSSPGAACTPTCASSS